MSRSDLRTLRKLVAVSLFVAVAIGAPSAAAKPHLSERCTISGSKHADTLEGNKGKDVICGNGGDDVVLAAGSADVILGGAGDDELHGQGGNDQLAGGPGSDILDGGPGANTCGPGELSVGRSDGLCIDYLTLSDIHLSGHEVDTTAGPRDIEISVRVTDTRRPALGIRDIVPVAEFKGGLSTSGSKPLAFGGGDAASGVWSGALTVPERIPAGTWSVGFIVVDNADEGGSHPLTANFGSADFAHAGEPQTFEQTGAGGVPPRITGVEVSPGSIDTSTGPARVNVTLRGFQAQILNFRLKAPVPGVVDTDIWVDQPIQISENQQQYQLRLPFGIAHGRWQLRDVMAVDHGLIRRYQATDLEQLGFDSGFNQTGPGDSEAPVLHMLKITPTQFSSAQNPDQILNVKGHATDDFSGVAYAWLGYGSQGAAGIYYPGHDPVAIETGQLSKDAWWDEPLPIQPPGTRPPPTGWIPLTVQVVDGAHNERSFTTAQLYEAGFPWALYNAP